MLYERGNAAKQWILGQLHERFGDRAARILDLGCGDGSKWTVFLSAHPSIRVVGVDTDRCAILRGVHRVSPQLDLRVSDAQEPLQDTFDAVVAFSAIEHVVNREAFLKTVRAALAPGGIAYLNYDDGHFRSRNLKERLMVPVSQLLALFGVEGPYMKHVDDAAFRRLAESQGFRVVAFRKHNLHPLKGFMRGASDEAVQAWVDFEEYLGRQYPPERLDRIMWSSTLVLEVSQHAATVSSAPPSLVRARTGPRPFFPFRRAALWFFSIILLVLCVNPNPFANMAPVISDESYFLTAAVSALQSHTIPGFVQDPGGAYYGALLSYLLFFCIGAAAVVAHLAGASAQAIAEFLAFHWGDATHLGRLLNGLAAWGMFMILGRKAFRWRSDPLWRDMGSALLLYLILLCGGSLFFPLAHTSRVWASEIIFFSFAAWRVLEYEWKRQHNLPRESPERHLFILFAWSLAGVAQAMQLSLVWLWAVWALLLRQVTIRQAWRTFIRFLPIVAAAAVLLFSFGRNMLGLIQSLVDSGTGISAAAFGLHGFYARAIWPWQALWETHPALCVIGIIALACAFFSTAAFFRLRVHQIAIGQVLLTFLLLHLILGFTAALRYVLPLTASFALLTAFLVTAAPVRLRQTLLGVAIVIALVTSVKTASLYWQPSSQAHAMGLVRRELSDRDTLVLQTDFFTFPVSGVDSLRAAEELGEPVFRREWIAAESPRYALLAPPFFVARDSGKAATRPALPEDYWSLSEACDMACTRPGPPGRVTCFASSPDACLGEIGTAAEGSTGFRLFLQAHLIGTPLYLSHITAVSSTLEETPDIP